VIVDIKTTSSLDETCIAMDPEYELLSNFSWSGTIDGCDCRNNYRTKSKRMLQERRLLEKFVPKDMMYKNDLCNET
jgi:hypothetical protein